MTDDTSSEVTGKKLPRESWESFAERRIRAAQESGAFENLPGFGQPIQNIDQSLNENWWIREKLKREQLSALPPILQARLEIEKSLEAIQSLTSEYQVRRRLEQLNEAIGSAHYSHIAGPAEGVRPINIEQIITEWKQQQQTEEGSDDRPTG